MLGVVLITICLLATPGHAQVIKSFQKISALAGGLTEAGAILEKGDDFGESLDTIGDLDGDGVIDLVVGALKDDDGGIDRGAVYIIFLNTDGTVKQAQKISSTQGGFTGNLDDEDNFGIGATGLGDLDGDGVLDIAVGASGDDDGGTNRGAVYILFLNSDGTVKSHQKISALTGGFTGTAFSLGQDLAMLGDLDGDGIGDLFVKPFKDEFWLLYLNADGTVKQNTKIRISQFDGDDFGNSGALLGDLDNDGVMDLAVGAQFDDDGGFRQGAVWILFMNADGTVKSRQKISASQGGFTGLLEPDDQFGQSVSPAGDRNGDGIPDLIVGAEHAASPDGNLEKTGEVWILHLNRNGTVQSHELIRSGSDNFTTLRKNDNLGQAVTFLGDLDGDGVNDIAISADGDRDCATCSNNTGVMTGAVYVLFLQGSTPPGSNQAPMLMNIGDQTVSEGNLLMIPVMATDDDGPAPLGLSVTGAPAGADFMDHGNGFGTFSWTPGMDAADLSPYSVTFHATEAGMAPLSDSQTVMIFVNPVGGGSQTAVYEFEDLTIANSDGTIASVTKTKAAASNGAYFFYKSNAIGEFVTFPIPISAAGTYSLDVQHHLSKYRGTFQVDVADTLTGPYTQTVTMNTTVASGSSFPTLTMPATFASSGTKYLRFTVIGSNPSTGSEKMGLDKVDVISQGGGGNQAPMLMNIGDQTVSELDTLTIPVMATDNDGDPLILAATIVDKDGATVTDANFTDAGGGIGEFMWTPDMDAADLSPYSVTFTATEAAGMTLLSDSQTITLAVLPFGTVSGNLSANLSPFTAGSLNLSAQGTTDWARWKGGSIINFIHKDNVTLQISNYTLIGSEAPTGSGSKTTYSWTDGTPTISGSATGGLRVFNVGSGFRVVVVADTTPRTLRMYVGAKNARGQFAATLSDGTPAFSTLINQPSRLGTHLVTLSYQAASPGQTLTIEYTMDTRFKTSLKGSQINLEAATLN